MAEHVEVAESQEEDRQLEHRLGWSGAAEMDKVRVESWK